MKIIQAENIGEIPLGQFQKYAELLERTDLKDADFNKRKIHIFTGIPQRDVAKIKQIDYKDILEQIDKALEVDAPFEKFFTINGFEFGFHPNLDEMSTAEFADLSKYGTEVETLEKTMAILFRPIVEKVGSSYTIESYNGSKQYSELMKEMPLSIVNGALGFFCSLAKELRIHTQRYTIAELLKVQAHLTTSLNGDGMPQS